MDKWEHCIIASEKVSGVLGRDKGNNRVIYYMTANGFQRQVIADNYNSMDARGKTLSEVDGPVIGRLGNEGWQLVYIDDNSGCLYFKRRVTE